MFNILKGIYPIFFFSFIFNTTHDAWEVQDHMLLVWLQSTLSKSVLPRVLGSNHLNQVWEKIHKYFGL